MDNSSNQCTLLLSQFGRQEFTDRFFSYLEYTASPYPVVFCDGNADGQGRDAQQKFLTENNYKN